MRQMKVCIEVWLAAFYFLQTVHLVGRLTSSRNFMTNIRIDHGNWDNLKLLCFLKSVYNYLPNIFIVVCSPRQKRHHPIESDFFGCPIYKIIESNNYRIDRQVRKLNEYSWLTSPKAQTVKTKRCVHQLHDLISYSPMSLLKYFFIKLAGRISCLIKITTTSL